MRVIENRGLGLDSGSLGTGKVALCTCTNSIEMRQSRYVPSLAPFPGNAPYSYLVGGGIFLIHLSRAVDIPEGAWTQSRSGHEMSRQVRRSPMDSMRNTQRTSPMSVLEGKQTSGAGIDSRTTLSI